MKPYVRELFGSSISVPVPQGFNAGLVRQLFLRSVIGSVKPYGATRQIQFFDVLLDENEVVGYSTWVELEDVANGTSVEVQLFTHVARAINPPTTTTQALALGHYFALDFVSVDFSLPRVAAVTIATREVPDIPPSSGLTIPVNASIVASSPSLQSVINMMNLQVQGRALDIPSLSNLLGSISSSLNQGNRVVLRFRAISKAIDNTYVVYMSDVVDMWYTALADPYSPFIINVSAIGLDLFRIELLPLVVVLFPLFGIEIRPMIGTDRGVVSGNVEVDRNGRVTVYTVARGGETKVYPVLLPGDSTRLAWATAGIPIRPEAFEKYSAQLPDVARPGDIIGYMLEVVP